MKISEIFISPQGEGQYTGHLSIWVRFFGCNLQCDGFNQKDPTSPTELPYKNFDASTITSLKELPNFEVGCDSSYSWAAKFKHLYPEMTAAEVAAAIIKLLPNKPSFSDNPSLGNYIHLVFTGGEPLLPVNQNHIVEILNELFFRKCPAVKITIETNGTQSLTQSFIDYMYVNTSFPSPKTPNELFFSISPKLHHTSGELPSKAIKPEIINSYRRLSSEGQLKFVVNGTEESWRDLDNAIAQVGDSYPIWIMPVSRYGQDEKSETIKIVDEAIRRGYNVAARVHNYIFGAQPGR